MSLEEGEGERVEKESQSGLNGKVEVMTCEESWTDPPFCLAYSTTGAKSFSYLGSLMAARMSDGLVVA